MAWVVYRGYVGVIGIIWGLYKGYLGIIWRLHGLGLNQGLSRVHSLRF